MGRGQVQEAALAAADFEQAPAGRAEADGLGQPAAVAPGIRGLPVEGLLEVILVEGLSMSVPALYSPIKRSVS